MVMQMAFRDGYRNRDEMNMPGWNSVQLLMVVLGILKACSQLNVVNQKGCLD